MGVTIHGIRNCDTMKKARAWLDGRGIAYDFHDYKTQGIKEATLRAWARELGWRNVINQAGTTFRRLPEVDREGLTEDRAIALMLTHPSMIRRPILDLGARRMAGFSPATYEAALS